LISYDTQPIATQKADYINRLNLGGAMWWELDADAPEDTGRALVRTVKERLGGLEWRENELGYPGSSEWRRWLPTSTSIRTRLVAMSWVERRVGLIFAEYENLRRGM
jgi:chitinase